MAARFAAPLWALAPLFGATLLGCSSSQDAPAQQTQDLRTSCLQMASWAHASNTTCTVCISRSQTQCACTGNDYGGKCADASRAKVDEPDCTKQVSECVSACASSDCDCVLRCYAGHDRCLGVSTDLESCLSQTCEPSCR